MSFDSVEEFWGIYNNIPKASELPQKSDYHLFKFGVRPEWEDPQNSKGGKWAYQCKDKRSVNIDDLWLNSVCILVPFFVIIIRLIINACYRFWESLERRLRTMEIMRLWEQLLLFGKLIIESHFGLGQLTIKRDCWELGKILFFFVLLLITDNICSRRFKELLRLPPSEQVEFASHSDAASSGSSRARSRFSV